MDNKKLTELAKIADILEKNNLTKNTEIIIKLDNYNFNKLKQEIEDFYKKSVSSDNSIIISINQVKFIINKSNV